MQKILAFAFLICLPLALPCFSRSDNARRPKFVPDLDSEPIPKPKFPKFPKLNETRLEEFRSLDKFLSWSRGRREVLRAELFRRLDLGLLRAEPAYLMLGMLDDSNPGENLFGALAPDINKMTLHGILINDLEKALFPQTPIDNPERVRDQSANGGKLMQKIVGRGLKSEFDHDSFDFQQDVQRDRADLSDLLPTLEEKMSLAENGDKKLASSLEDSSAVLTALLDSKMLEWHDELHGYTSYVSEEDFNAEVSYCFRGIEEQRRGLTYVCSLLQLEASLDMLRTDYYDLTLEPSGPLLGVPNSTSIDVGNKKRFVITASVLATFAFYGVFTLLSAASIGLTAKSVAIQIDQHRLLTSTTTTTPRTTTERVEWVRPKMSDTQFLWLARHKTENMKTFPVPDFDTVTEMEKNEYLKAEIIWQHAIVAWLLRTHKQSILTHLSPGSFVIPLKNFVKHQYFYKLISYMMYETSLAMFKSHPWIHLVNFKAAAINPETQVLYGWLGHPRPQYNLTYTDETGAEVFDYDLQSHIPLFLMGNGTVNGFTDTRYEETMRMASTTMPNSTTNPFETVDPTAVDAGIKTIEEWQHWRNTIFEDLRDCDKMACSEFDLSHHLVRKKTLYMPSASKQPRLTKETARKLGKRVHKDKGNADGG